LKVKKLGCRNRYDDDLLRSVDGDLWFKRKKCSKPWRSQKKCKEVFVLWRFILITYTTF
jgi:hypothetical protein